jgi:hypothetical protein
MHVFATDMKAAGRNGLVTRVRSVQHQAALFVSGHGDHWIILPDKTAILWRWESLDHILKWKVNEFPAHECTDYRTVSGGVRVSSSLQVEYPTRLTQIRNLQPKRLPASAGLVSTNAAGSRYPRIEA